jgi:hypothetical protein
VEDRATVELDRDVVGARHRGVDDFTADPPQ